MRSLYPLCTWQMPSEGKRLYLTFDDGPHPVVTPYVLDTLRQFNARATFFCIGNNVAAYPAEYKRILEDGHTTGNHTYDHVNGWKVPDATYFNDVIKAQQYIDSPLFRPPYGRITRFQAKQLTQVARKQIIMWTVCSGDFDVRLSPAKCLENVVRNSKSGSIIVFHDSEKAYDRLAYALPKVLKFFSDQGFTFECIGAR